MFIRDESGIYRAPGLAGLDWLEHGFASRHAPGWPGSYTNLKQIHSDQIAVAEGEGFIGEGDALISAEVGRVIGVRTADCVPLLIVDERLRAIAAVHAGWRGTAAEIAQKTVRRMVEEFGSEPAALHAAVGPCIGECCYEVGQEVAEKFHRFVPRGTTLRRLDLADVNRRQLIGAGVDPARIEVSGLCTSCHWREFESYRRDGNVSGRMVSAIAIRSDTRKERGPFGVRALSS